MERGRGQWLGWLVEWRFLALITEWNYLEFLECIRLFQAFLNALPCVWNALLSLFCDSHLSISILAKHHQCWGNSELIQVSNSGLLWDLVGTSSSLCLNWEWCSCSFWVFFPTQLWAWKQAPSTFFFVTPSPLFSSPTEAPELDHSSH